MNKDLNPFSGRKIKVIELIFENFESFKVEVSGVCDFNMFNIKYSISFFAQSENDGDINPGTYCDMFFLALNEKGKNVKGEIDNTITLEEYLKEHYITQVDLLFDSDEHLYVSVPLGDEDDTNSLQSIENRDDCVLIKINGLDE